MTTPEFFVTPGYGDYARKNLHYTQALRVGNRVDISGQGGWDDEINFPADLEEEIVKAFDNVEHTLSMAGASWPDVVAVDSFHIPETTDFVGDVATRVMVEQMRLRMGERGPIWTQIGVAALGAPNMRVEIKVTAIVPDARESA